MVSLLHESEAHVVDGPSYSHASFRTRQLRPLIRGHPVQEPLVRFIVTSDLEVYKQPPA